MYTKLSLKWVGFAVMVIVLSALAIFVVLQLRPAYIGAEAKLSKPDDKTALQIDKAEMTTLPKIKPSVQATFKITNFAGNYAKGVVTYSDKSPTEQFMAVKVGNNWKIITHNPGKGLNLPDIKTAQLYGLPKGWYKS